MMPTLPEKSALDYNSLRQEGIQHLERLADPLWTDFNVHDPGITILEQLCYALTDLGYRIDYELPDLLARDGEDTYASLYGPTCILSSQPVTLTDLRKQVVDVAGVKNAWIEPVTEPQPSLYYQPLQQELRLTGDTDAAEPIKLKGLYRVLIEKSVLDVDSAVLVREVARRLHACRNLGEDFDEIRILDTQAIQVHASVEITPTADAEEVLLAIYEKIAAYLSPAVPFYTLSQGLVAGKPIDEIIDGPLLDHGFIDTAAFEQLERKNALRTSDLIHEIMDVGGVKAVTDIVLASGDRQEKWSLDLDPQRTPRLDLQGSRIDLERKQLPLGIDAKGVIQRYNERQRKAASLQPLAPAEREIELPPGRDRHSGHYYSIQHQFPTAYGIGELGLPASATPARQAQAKQLKAYLLFFEQLLANAFAQLAHLRNLLGFLSDNSPTYAAGLIDDSRLGLDDIRVQEPAEFQRRLGQLAENPYAPPEATDPAIDWSRKNRFLDHLLARFAEQFSDYALRYETTMAEQIHKTTVAERLAETKQAFLQQYPRLSGGRGTAYNYLLPWGPDNLSGLEQRLRLKLGITTQEQQFHLVEHILLRPLEGDRQQEAPLLANACRQDPYSLQISLVFPWWWPFPQDTQQNAQQKQQQEEFQQVVEQTVREETPAHLTPYLHWLNEDDMTAFESAWRNWLDQQRRYWADKLGL